MDTELILAIAGLGFSIYMVIWAGIKTAEQKKTIEKEKRDFSENQAKILSQQRKILQQQEEILRQQRENKTNDEP